VPLACRLHHWRRFESKKHSRYSKQSLCTRIGLFLLATLFHKLKIPPAPAARGDYRRQGEKESKKKAEVVFLLCQCLRISIMLVENIQALTLSVCALLKTNFLNRGLSHLLNSFQTPPADVTWCVRSCPLSRARAGLPITGHVELARPPKMAGQGAADLLVQLGGLISAPPTPSN